MFVCGMKRKFGTDIPTSAVGNPIAIAHDEWIRALNRIMAFIRGFLIRVRTNAILGFNY